jgi:hypothetical protein
MKKIRGDNPIGIIIHMYMERSQGNSCVAPFISNKQKCHFILFLVLFSSMKLENRRAEQVLQGRGMGARGVGREEGKGEGE